MSTAATVSPTTIKSGTATAIVSVKVMVIQVVIAVATTSEHAVIYAKTKTSNKAMDNTMCDLWHMLLLHRTHGSRYAPVPSRSRPSQQVLEPAFGISTGHCQEIQQ